MQTFDELEKITDSIVLVDTNVVINLENRQCSDNDLKAISNILTTDIKLFLTDLSYCELIAGCRNLEDFKHYLKVSR